MTRTEVLLLVSLFLTPTASLAQVEARQATPEEIAAPGTEADVEVPSPMLLEMSLGSRQDGKIQRKSLHEIPMGYQEVRQRQGPCQKGPGHEARGQEEND